MNSDILPLTVKVLASLSTHQVVVVHIWLLARLMLCCSGICCGCGTVSYLLSLSLERSNQWKVSSMGPETRKGKIPKLDELHIFPVHLLSQHPVGIFKAQHSQSKLIFPDPSGVTRLFGGKIIFSAIFFSFSFPPIFPVFTHLRRSQYLSSFLTPGPGEARPVSWCPPWWPWPVSLVTM